MLNELRDKLAKSLERMSALLDTADAEKRNLTEAEEKEYGDIDADVPKIKAEIARREKLEAEKAEAGKAVRSPKIYRGKEKNDPKEFCNLGEFLHSVRFNHDDPRLRDLYEERDQSMGVGEAGGFMVPKQLREGLLSLTPQQAIFRPRATIIPAGSPPDAEISMVALNQGAQKNMYGGVSFAWLAEGGTKPATDMALKEITLRPHEIAGHTVITDKLLRNWSAAASTIEAQFRLAMIAAEEDAFYKGTGVGQPLGLLKSPARIEIARNTANQVKWADIYGMYARLRMNSSPVWIASQTVIPYLVTIADAASMNLWMQSAAPGLPPTLMGIPVMFNERSVALGTAGDLILADLSQYLIKDGSGPFVAMSEHVYFTSNKSVIKIFWNVDGQPWLDAPIPLEGSTSNTVSPFIVLK
jgi:HK97 family phage major capsid protein